jgi:hypothetical protein
MPVWFRKTSDDGAAYDLNEDHPTLARLAERIGPDGSPDLRRALRLIAASLPLDALLHDLSSRPRGVSTSDMDDDDVAQTAREALGKLIAGGMKASSVGRMLAAVPPYRGTGRSQNSRTSEMEARLSTEGRRFFGMLSFGMMNNDITQEGVVNLFEDLRRIISISDEEAELILQTAIERHGVSVSEGSTLQVDFDP